MPLPLKPGFNFNYDRKEREPYYEMASAEAYTEFYGISFMISGERLIYSPTFTTITYAGELVFIPLNVYRRTTYVSNSPYERILIKFNDKMLKECIDTIGQETYDELCKEHIIRFTDKTRDKIMTIFMEMEEEWNNYGEYSELVLKGLLNRLIVTCIRERIINDDNKLVLEEQQHYIADAIKYIKTNLKESPSLKTTSDYLNISGSYLSKLFTTYLHTPYSTFVLNEKIAYAQKLLTDTNISLTDIALESGFSGSSYFCDSFKRVMGESPLQFRKNRKDKK